MKRLSIGFLILLMIFTSCNKDVNKVDTSNSKDGVNTTEDVSSMESKISTEKIRKDELRFNFLGAEQGYIGFELFYEGHEDDVKDLFEELDKVKVNNHYKFIGNTTLVHENKSINFDFPTDSEELAINIEEYEDGEKKQSCAALKKGDKGFELITKIYESALESSGLSPEIIQKAYDENFSLNNLK
ncbi:hypothetical protein [Mediannikoviicoccus vaginalis]|uniref:hypothetical protein n=1 Tax=Mediannikoviicoccus vaginalis TaxID=2899727 RepID=UPI001F32CE8A|nr:hypothetical protein [Mediannikoviicoccus vaginalis]